MQIDVMRVEGFDPDIPLPEFATKGAAGADLRLNLADRGSVTLDAGKYALLPTGLAFAIPAGFEMQVRPRSGLASRHGVTVLNAPGTVDSDYRGHVQVLLINHGPEAVTFGHGERIAQAVIAAVAEAGFVLVGQLDETARGGSGFGSTGRE